MEVYYIVYENLVIYNERIGKYVYVWLRIVGWSFFVE